jgi:hypothetical protein
MTVVMSADIGDKYAKVSDVFITQVTPPNKQGYVNLGLTRLPDVWRSINDLTWRIDYQTFLKLFFDVVHK